MTQGRLVLRELHGATLSNGGNHEPDDALLVQAARVDPAAFAPLYERYRDRVYWYLRTRATSADEAGDLLQQVFLRALHHLDQYKPQKGPFAGWLFSIARNIAINTHRDRRTTVSWDFIPDVLRPASPDDPEAQALRNESLEWLADAFVRLDRNKRELLVLRYVVGLSFAAIAAVLAWTLVVSPLFSGQGASAAAARVLRSEARVAARQPAVTPQPGEFTYTRSQGANVDGVVLPGGRTYDVLVHTTREIWVAVDGSGRIRQVSAPDGFPTPSDRSVWAAAGSPSLSQLSASETYDKTFGPGDLASPLNIDGLNRAQLLDMQNDPSALASAIHAIAAQNPNPLGFEMLTIIGDLLSESAAPPQLRSSLYQVAATIPGVQLLGTVRDPAGRKGIAVASDARLELIFDPATSVLLATEQTPAQAVAVDGTPVPPRAVTDYTLYFQSDIVSSDNETADGG